MTRTCDIEYEQSRIACELQSMLGVVHECSVRASTGSMDICRYVKGIHPSANKCRRHQMKSCGELYLGFDRDHVSQSDRAQCVESRLCLHMLFVHQTAPRSVVEVSNVEDFQSFQVLDYIVFA